MMHLKTQSLSSKLYKALTNDGRRRDQLELFIYAIEAIVSGVNVGVVYEEAVKECVRDEGVIKLLLTIKP